MIRMTATCFNIGCVEAVDERTFDDNVIIHRWKHNLYFTLHGNISIVNVPCPQCRQNRSITIDFIND
jgi:hypothetical protein